MLIDEFMDFSFINTINSKTYKVNKSYYYKKLLETSFNENIRLHEGKYTYTIGPSYETESEIKEIIKLNGKAVGMSTFPEFKRTKELKLTSIFISCLTNYGAGLISDKKITHKDVLDNADNSKDLFVKLIIKFIENTEHQKRLKK